jgi:hypothetical protein
MTQVTKPTSRLMYPVEVVWGGRRRCRELFMVMREAGGSRARSDRMERTCYQKCAPGDARASSTVPEAVGALALRCSRMIRRDSWRQPEVRPGAVMLGRP